MNVILSNFFLPFFWTKCLTRSSKHFLHLPCKIQPRLKVQGAECVLPMPMPWFSIGFLLSTKVQKSFPGSGMENVGLPRLRVNFPKLGNYGICARQWCVLQSWQPQYSQGNLGNHTFLTVYFLFNIHICIASQRWIYVVIFKPATHSTKQRRKALKCSIPFRANHDFTGKSPKLFID